MKIGLIGAGNIARVIAEAGRGYRVAFVYDFVEEKGKEFARRYGCEFRRPEEFSGVNLVVEAASQGAVVEYAEGVVDRGMNLMIMSVGALVDTKFLDRLLEKAERRGVKVMIPSGAIAGLDGIRSAAIGKIESVVLTTTKPPANLGVEGTDKRVVYDGPAREAVRRFPKNVNVAATLSLAGIGFDKTRVRIVADPGVRRNQHEVEVKGEFGELYVRVQNVPSPANPKTSYLAALSAVATIEGFGKGLKIA